MLLRVFVLFAALVAFATPAAAVYISQKMSMSELQATCAKVGGTYTDSAGTFGTCTNENCDGQGGTCTVSCDSQSNCSGTTPRTLISPQTLVSILQDGDMVLHDIDLTPTGSLSTPVEGSAAPAAPGQPGKP